MKETVPRALDGERVDRVVAFLTGLPRSEVADLVAAGAVRLAGSTVDTRARRVSEGDVVDVDMPAPADDRLVPDAGVELTVVYDDADVIVIDKPAGLVVHPGAGRPAGTLVHGLVARFPDVAAVGDPRRPGIVHRLDKGTSGLMVVARTPAALADLTAQLKARTIERRYLALVLGEVAEGKGVVDAPVGRSARQPTRMAVTNRGRAARTRYEVLERYTEPVPATLLECRLETGRTHQVRVHLAAIGHPVAGDTRYGRGQALAMNRPFLHAHSLAFDHPGDGTRRQFESPLPADLEAVRERLH
jgi:23S rRNA pseudouridine1911/1915/1917 synthase